MEATIADFSKLTGTLQQKLNDGLSSLTRQSVDLSLKDCGLLSITEVHDWLKSPESAITTVYIPIMGEVTGDIFVFLNQRAAYSLADLMIGNPLGTTTYISDFESSALKEMGNITTGIIVTEIANLLKLSMMLTVPNLATDMAGALVDQVLIEYGETSDKLLVLNFPFSIQVQNQKIEGSFVLFFDKNSSDIIAKKLDQHNNQSGI